MEERRQNVLSHSLFWNILSHQNILHCMLFDVKTPT